MKTHKNYKGRILIQSILLLLLLLPLIVHAETESIDSTSNDTNTNSNSPSETTQESIDPFTGAVNLLKESSFKKKGQAVIRDRESGEKVTPFPIQPGSRTRS